MIVPIKKYKIFILHHLVLIKWGLLQLVLMTLCCQRDNFLKVKRNHPIILDVARNHAHQTWVHMYSIVFRVWANPWLGVLAIRVNYVVDKSIKGHKEEILLHGTTSKLAHRVSLCLLLIIVS